MEKDLLLSDITNYRHNIDNNIKNIISIYCSLLERYLIKCGELSPKKDKIYFTNLFIHIYLNDNKIDNEIYDILKQNIYFDIKLLLTHYPEYNNLFLN